MTSLTNRLIIMLLKARGAKRLLSDPDRLGREIAKRTLRPPSFSPPVSLDSEVNLSVDYTSGWPIYHLRPRSGGINRYGIYLHGGAWVAEIVPAQWKFVSEVVARAGVYITVVVYPVAPGGKAGVVMPRIIEMFSKLIGDHGADRVFAIGDSAGGQMCLSAAIALRDQGLPALGDTILISPGLDLRFDNPEIAEVERRDPFLSRRALPVAVDAWRGDLPVTDPLVSPMLAELGGLGPITLMSGTRDILNPDAKLLAEKLHAAGVDVTFYNEEGLVHVYPIFFGPEAKRARRQIVDRLSRK